MKEEGREEGQGQEWCDMAKTPLSVASLEFEERSMSRGVQVAWKMENARTRVLPRASRKEAQGDPFQTSDLQICKMLHLCCFQPRSLGVICCRSRRKLMENGFAPARPPCHGNRR